MITMARRAASSQTHAHHSTRVRLAAAAAATLTVLFTTGLKLASIGSAQAAAVAVPLGTADSYAVLAGSTVTNTGPSVIDGDVGLSPGTAVTGFPPGIVHGTTHAADAAAAQAKADLKTAYNVAAAEQPPTPVVGDLGGQTLTRGVYNSSSTLGLTGALTLDGQGDPGSVWVFQAGSTLTTASASHVRLINGASACNIFWQVGSSATLGTGSTFRGSLLALTSISVTTGATIHGRVLARNGAVTLDTDVISRPSCATSSPTGSPSPTGTTAPTSAPTSSPTSGPTTGPTGHTSGPTTGPTGHTGGTAGPTAGPSSTGGPHPGQVNQVPTGPVGTGDGGSVHRSHPILETTGVLALLASMAAFILWRREAGGS
jgi:hypothetical protein